MLNLFGVVVLHRSMVNWRRGPWYMCILLYVKLIRCIGVAQIYGWLEEGAWGQSAMGICAFFYMSNSCSVVVFQRSMLDWRRGHGVSLPWVYVHSSLCETYLVYWSCTDLWLIGGGAWGQSAMGICAFFYMSNFCSVVVFQRSMLHWRRGHGVSQPWLYVHSSICQNSAV